HVGFGRMLVPSESLRSELIAEGFAPRDLDLVPLALPPEVERRAFEVEPPTRAPEQPLVVACTSSHWEGKGVHVLLDAAALAVERGADLELVLVGDGDADYRARLAAQASRDVLAGRVRFTGRVQQRDLGRVFEHAHVFAFPSIWPEPFGRASLEAMAFGLALVASDAGGIPEQFVDGESGVKVPADDAPALAEALLALERDERRRMALATAGRARVDARYRSARFLDALETRIEAAIVGSAA
ncbi:MAG: glycosyltransferase family 4 protein, partial [Planctomycetota bacterium]